MPNMPEVTVGGVTYKLKDSDLRKDIVKVSDTQPTEENNRIWIQEGDGEYQVPTYEEFSNLKSAFTIENDYNRQGYTVLFPEMEVGFLNNSGDNQTGTNSKRTIDYHKIISGAVYTPVFQDSAYGIKLIIYNASYGYEARRFPTEPFVMSDIDPDGVYYRYAITTTDTTGHPVSATSAAFALESAVITDKTLTKQDTPADAKATGDAIENAVDNLEAEIDASKTTVKTANLIDLTQLTNGYLSKGVVTPDDNYRTTDFLPISKAGNYVKHIDIQGSGSTARPSIWLYDSDKEYQSRVTGTALSADIPGWYIFSLTSEYVGWYARLSTYNRNLNEFFFGESDGMIYAIPPYGEELKSGIYVNKSQIIRNDYEYDSPLTGKVWYVIGDSASHGDFSGITQETIKTGIYTGELPVYSFIIGNRTGMVVHNLAVNGAVMATIASQPSRYQWSADDHYKLVGSDADIITIWLGANDMWQHVPVGTIDSTDVTTFYGAYNTVLSYYVANYPKTKLGIVASFWCTQEYAEAVIALGAKYGVPVLNLYNDPSRPVTVGSQRPDVAESIKTQRNAQWVVSETNSHPSAAYHEIESYFIEEWLKTL